MKKKKQQKPVGIKQNSGKMKYDSRIKPEKLTFDTASQADSPGLFAAPLPARLLISRYFKK
jgi:hypothetical protein